MYILIGILATIIEAFLLFELLRRLMQGKRGSNFNYYSAILIDALLILFSNLISDQILIPILLSMSYELIISHKVIKGKLKVKAFIILVYNSMTLLVDYLICMVACRLLKVELSDVYSMNKLNCMLTVLSIGLLSLMVFGLLKLKQKKQLLKKYNFIFYGLPIYSILLYILFLNQWLTIGLVSSKDMLLYLAIGCTLCFNIFLIYSYNQVEKDERNEWEIKLLNQQLAYYQSIKSCYTQSFKEQHDLKKHLNMLSYLVGEGEFQKLQDYVFKLKEIESERCTQRFTKNLVLDAILNQKYYEAKKQNIEFYVMTEEIGETSHHPVYLCVLLGNILDNAIEACMRLKEENVAYTYIKVKLCQEEKIKGLVLSVTNSSKQPLIKEGEYVTTKEQAVMHGIGLKHIEEVMGKMGGIYTYGFDKGTFSFIAKIPEINCLE